MPENMQPRNAVARIGMQNVSEDVLIAILLCSGIKGSNVLDISRQLLREYGSLNAILGSSEAELAIIRGIGAVKAQIIRAALELGNRMNQEAVPEHSVVRTPMDVVHILKDQLRGVEIEIFYVLILTARNHLKDRPVEVSKGILDSSLVHPREIFKEAIRRSAGAVVLAHNHPSGDVSPSTEDVRITRQIIEAGKIIDIRVMDHVIIAHPAMSLDQRTSGFFSMRERGICEFN